jgi:hypothetical protein
LASNSTSTYTLTNAEGCDSVITLNLTINTVDITVTVTNPLITANATGAIYQWLDCNAGNAVIAEETAQSFTVSQIGNYAVEVTENGCTDTSACITISTVAIKETALFGKVSIFPNPTSGYVYIDLANQNNVSIRVYSVNGQVIYFKENINASLHQIALNEARGIYLIEVSSQNEIHHFKLVKI